MHKEARLGCEKGLNSEGAVGLNRSVSLLIKNNWFVVYWAEIDGEKVGTMFRCGHCGCRSCGVGYCFTCSALVD